jgi:hypothetical protein
MENTGSVKMEMSINQKLPENALTKLTWQVSIIQQKMESLSLKEKLS